MHVHYTCNNCHDVFLINKFTVNVQANLLQKFTHGRNHYLVDVRLALASQPKCHSVESIAAAMMSFLDYIIIRKISAKFFILKFPICLPLSILFPVYHSSLPSPLSFFLPLVILIGDANIGKTNLISRYTKNKYVNRIPTIGVHFEIRIIEVDRKTIKAQIWDTSEPKKQGRLKYGEG